MGYVEDQLRPYDVECRGAALRSLLDHLYTRRRALATLAGAVGLTGVAARHSVRSQPATSVQATGHENATSQSDNASTSPEIGPSGHFTEIQVFGDGTKHLIPIEDVVYGGPDKDDIPAIDEPQFVGQAGWESVGYRDDGLVIGVEIQGQRRAYPFQVLVWHEIANDMFNGAPLLVTYCPLCGSGIVFRREINDGEVVEFGVTGRLYNSDLLMYDRKTDTVWSQLTGTAVIGELTGQRLEIIPSVQLTWRDWKRTYPDSQVLSRETGYQRDYDSSPYGSYDQTTSIGFPVAAEDDRLHPKTRVTGVELDSTTFAAYPDAIVREHGPVNDTLGDTSILVVSDPLAGGNVLVFRRRVGNQTLRFSLSDTGLVDRETDTRWTFRGEAIEGELAGSQLEAIPGVKSFWFAWFAFHPDTELWLGST